MSLTPSILDSMLVMLDSPFMQNALLAGLLAGIACGIIGTLVVQTRLTFLAGGASHAAYGGIGLAFHFGLPVLPCTVAFSVLASLLMGGITLRGNNHGGSAASDSAIGVLWAAGMAFGIILIDLTPGYAGELMGFLFGSILTVPSEDLLAMAAFDAGLLIIMALFGQGLWALAIDAEFAKARGLPVNALYLLLVGLTAITVVMLIRVAGLILVLALLTIPSHLARGRCKSLAGAMAVAGALSLSFCTVGLLLSWFTNISSGAAIIAVAAAVYFLSHLPFLRKS